MKQNNEKTTPSCDLDRYSVQTLFAPIGPEGQQHLAQSTVTLIGCGALGSHLAQMIVRAGVGRLRIVDRDFLELSNLQRQTLFDEDDLNADWPKAVAAAEKLRRINSQVVIEPYVCQADRSNIESLIDGTDLVLDGTDNLFIRYLINDAAIKHHIPWVYGACVGAEGLVMAVLAGGRPCLRCVFDAPPLPDRIDTCRDIGIINSIVAVIAAYQLTSALKILTGNLDALDRRLTKIDLWNNRFTAIPLDALAEGCPSCGGRRFDFLDGKVDQPAVSLYGRNAVQIIPVHPDDHFDLAGLAQKFAPGQIVSRNPHLLRLKFEDYNMTLFPDGRAVIEPVTDLALAADLYNRLINE